MYNRTCFLKSVLPDICFYIFLQKIFMFMINWFCLSVGFFCYSTVLKWISMSSVRENASFGRSDDVTILLFRSKIAKNKPKENMAVRKAWFLVPSFNIREYQSLIIKRSLSESWELLTERIDKIFVILEGPSKKPPPFWSPSNVSTCSYVLFFNSLPNFFDIETNFPRNYNKLGSCHESFIGGNKLVKMATMYWKLPLWEMPVSDRKTTGSLHIIYREYLESFFVFTLYVVSLV